MRYAGTRLDVELVVVDRLLISVCRWAMRAVLAGSWASSAVSVEKLPPGDAVDSCSRSSWLSMRRIWLSMVSLPDASRAPETGQLTRPRKT
jgi:hypothetical protein